LVFRDFPGSLVVRPGLVIGKSFQGDVGTHDFLKSRLEAKLPVSYFVDEFRSPIRAEEFAEGVELLVGKRCRGIYHLGGPERASRYDVACRLAREWGLEREVESKSRVDEKEIPRIGDCSLDSSKAGREGWAAAVFS